MLKEYGMPKFNIRLQVQNALRLTRTCGQRFGFVMTSNSSGSNSLLKEMGRIFLSFIGVLPQQLEERNRVHHSSNVGLPCREGNGYLNRWKLNVSSRCHSVDVRGMRSLLKCLARQLNVIQNYEARGWLAAVSLLR
ncbi:hypothetical protein TNCV_5135461 [Trichonephila clavipes]|nr:hypothetical protein TNCV_5135461 [Trichonephila clavipes]